MLKITEPIEKRISKIMNRLNVLNSNINIISACSMNDKIHTEKTLLESEANIVEMVIDEYKAIVGEE